METASSPATVEQALKDSALLPGPLSKDGRVIQRELVATF